MTLSQVTIPTITIAILITSLTSSLPRKQTLIMSSYEEPNNPELESFRQQWRAEVQARAARHASSSQRQQHRQHHESHAGPSSTSPAQPIRVTTPRGKPPASAKKTVVKDSEDDYVRSQPFDEPVHATGAAQGEKGKGAAGTQQEPVTALEHYERAVEKEAAGNLGESLRLYRKAFQVSCCRAHPCVGMGMKENEGLM